MARVVGMTRAHGIFETAVVFRVLVAVSDLHGKGIPFRVAVKVTGKDFKFILFLPWRCQRGRTRRAAAHFKGDLVPVDGYPGRR